MKCFNLLAMMSLNTCVLGLVKANFHHDHGAGDYLRELKEECKALKAQDTPQRQIRYSSEHKMVLNDS